MGIAGVGYTGYAGFVPGIGGARFPSAQRSGSAALSGPGSSPAQMPSGSVQPNPASGRWPNPYAIFRSPDGDSAELSLPARQAMPTQQFLPSQQPFPTLQFMPAQQPIPSQQPLPSLPDPTVAMGNEPKPLIPEMPGSGLLDAIKPEGECQTCANRKYVDGSDDPSVSYQTPTKISPNMAGAAVAAHEQEHVRNEQANAQRDGREIVSQTVTLQYDCCPECGKSYVSGGTTRTTSVSKGESPVAEAMGSEQEGDTGNQGRE